ncbi:MAG: hypothetical protein PHH85_02375 [Candidatus Methanoperedens sp.]|nr:hypothetical protein [Candidatus Methanoperedens sp.]
MKDQKDPGPLLPEQDIEPLLNRITSMLGEAGFACYPVGNPVDLRIDTTNFVRGRDIISISTQCDAEKDTIALITQEEEECQNN